MDALVAVSLPSFSVLQNLIKWVQSQNYLYRLGWGLRWAHPIQLGLGALHTTGTTQPFLLLGADVHYVFEKQK